MSHLYLANWGDKYFLTKNFSARRHLPTQQPCLPGQDSGSDDHDADHDVDHYVVDQVDGAQKQLVGSLGAIERMLGIITEKLQVHIPIIQSLMAIVISIFAAICLKPYLCQYHILTI